MTNADRREYSLFSCIQILRHRAFHLAGFTEATQRIPQLSTSPGFASLRCSARVMSASFSYESCFAVHLRIEE